MAIPNDARWADLWGMRPEGGGANATGAWDLRTDCGGVRWLAGWLLVCAPQGVRDFAVYRTKDQRQ